MKIGYEDRSRPFDPDEPDSNFPAHLLLVTTTGCFLTDGDDRVIVLTSRTTLREFFSRIFPDGKPITIGGAVLSPFQVVSFGAFEWSSVKDELGEDAFCEFESAMDAVRSIQLAAMARLDAIRKDLEANLP